MSRIDELFGRLRTEGRKALMPFLTAGDPDLEFTESVIDCLAEAGCSLCELGIPYSDPIADGPVIQASYTRALESGVKLARIWETVQRVSARHAMPLVVMVSYSIVFRRGLERFVKEAKDAGAAGAIVPDLLVEHAADLRAVCRANDFSLIHLVTPTTPRDRALRIAESSSGFLYYVSVTGITGERRELPADLVDKVAWLRRRIDLPVCIGFGISQPEHVRQLAPVADGLIVGSAFVRRIEQAARKSRAEVLDDIRHFAKQLLEAMEDAG